MNATYSTTSDAITYGIRAAPPGCESLVQGRRAQRLREAAADDTVSTGAGAGPMPAGEFRSVIDYLGLTQDDTAALLDVSTRTVRHWIAGRYPVPDGVRDAIERGETWTAQAVDELVDTLKDVRDPAVLVYRSDEAMWAARPELRPWPAKWWRHVAMRASAKVPGVAIMFDGELEVQ